MDTAASRDATNALIGKKVVDQQGEEIGTVDGIWLDPSTYSVEFVGVKTGWVLGKTHLVPAKEIEMAVDDQTIRLRCPSALVKTAPTFVPGYELAEVDKEQVNAHYGVSVPAERVTDIEEVRPGEGLNPDAPGPREDPGSLALTGEPLPESEHTAAEHAYPSNRALENLTNEAHGQGS